MLLTFITLHFLLKYFEFNSFLSDFFISVYINLEPRRSVAFSS